MRAPKARNIELLKGYVKHFEGTMHTNSGSFKQVWREDGLPLVLKRTYLRDGTWQSWEADDLMLEICVQFSGNVDAGDIVPYVAWGYVDGHFWALQPRVDWVDDLRIAEEEGELECYSGATALPDCHPDHNTGVYEGRAVAYDWGYGYQRKDRHIRECGVWMEVMFNE